MSLTVNIGFSGLWQKVHLVQPHSYACPCVCLPPYPFSSAAAHPSRPPPPGSSLFAPQPSAHLPPSARSHLLSYLLAALAESPGAAGRTLHNASSIGLHKHPLRPGGEEVTWSLLRGCEGPLWPLLQALPVGHVLVHQCG